MRRSQAESLFLFCLLLATFLVPYFSLIQPLVESMVAVKYELCGGNQSFVVARNAERPMGVDCTWARCLGLWHQWPENPLIIETKLSRGGGHRS